MKSFDISEALNGIPEDMVDACFTKKSVHSSGISARLMGAVAAAACLVITVGTVLLIGKLRSVPSQTNVSSSESSDLTTETGTVLSGSEQTVTEPVQTGDPQAAVTDAVISSDETGIIVSGKPVADGQTVLTVSETTGSEKMQTTPDPFENSGTNGTKPGETNTAETQTTEPAYRVLPVSGRYQFCQWTSEWRDEFDTINQNGTWGQMGINRMIRSYDELKGIRLNTDYTDYNADFFRDRSLIICFAEFREIGTKPEVTEVTVEKRGTSGLYDITVKLSRNAGLEAAMQRWLCFLEVKNSDLGGLKDRPWYSGTIHIDVADWQTKTDSSVLNGKQRSCFKWFDTFHDYRTSSSFFSELSVSQDLLFRCENDAVSVIKDGKIIWSIDGMPLINAYFADLNGDGTNELCVTWGFGSGIYSEGVTVYDINHNIRYVLNERGKYNYTLFENQGRLLVKRMSDPDFDPYSDFYETGSIRIQNGNLVFTHLTREPDVETIRQEIFAQLDGLKYNTENSSACSGTPQYRLCDGHGNEYLFYNWEYVRRTDTGLAAEVPESLFRRIVADYDKIGLQSSPVEPE